MRGNESKLQARKFFCFFLGENIGMKMETWTDGQTIDTCDEYAVLFSAMTNTDATAAPRTINDAIP